MIHIEDFTASHIEQAQHIALQNYHLEREHVPTLPQVDIIPDLLPFAENGLGVAAFDGGEMVGFLCSVPPFNNAFHSTDAVGVFSPMGTNGVVGESWDKIFARMYQAAGEKWTKAGATSHAVCLYAHDKEAQAQFFRYGFGLRCVDAIRPMEPMDVSPCDGYGFSELAPEAFASVYPLDLMLNTHYCNSPFFMRRQPDTLESFIHASTKRSSRFFAANYQGNLCAYLKLGKTGETFITEQSDYRHIGGAFCLPDHRGKGVYQHLLNFALSTLKAEGYARLGVDFESINPTAYGFWLKYFDAYTHSVVRRIDEHVLTNSQ